MKVNACLLFTAPKASSFESILPTETLGGQNTINNDDTWELENILSSFIS